MKAMLCGVSFEAKALRVMAVAAVGLLGIGVMAHGQSVTIAFCHVGNAGNPADPKYHYGAVDHEYDIGKYDVTEEQYVAFLNAVARDDKFGCYNVSMADGQSGDVTPGFRPPSNVGILRTGEPGSYKYSVVETSGSYPVDGVTWFDAARFCNWLQNGQPKNAIEAEGTTETGAYDLKGDHGRGDRHGLENRNPDAKYWIPSRDEWYKAAFYDPGQNGNGGYWRYATRSNTPPGNTIGNGANEANYIINGTASVKTKSPTYPQKQISLLTPVGSFPSSVSYYGTCDQAGEIENWTGTLDHIYKNDPVNGRWIIGGNCHTFEANPLPGGSYGPADGRCGFRVATKSSGQPGN